MEVPQISPYSSVNSDKSHQIDSNGIRKMHSCVSILFERIPISSTVSVSLKQVTKTPNVCIFWLISVVAL